MGSNIHHKESSLLGPNGNIMMLDEYVTHTKVIVVLICSYRPIPSLCVGSKSESIIEPFCAKKLPICFTTDGWEPIDL